jgi:transmembrane sensor
MSGITRLNTRAEIDETAAVWVWRMDSASVSAADRRSFEAWLRKDPRHRRAYAELAEVWSALDGLAEAKRHEKIATFTARTGRFMVPGQGRRWALAAAATLAIAAVGAYWMQDDLEHQTLATAVGQQRSVTLVDGSIVTLNTNTIIETDLRRNLREIYLRKGEAHFQVAHDRSRPFLVHAGDAVVRAVGTAFEVRVLRDRQVDVVVNEGRVEVQTPMPAPAQPRAGARFSQSTQSLRAGQHLSGTDGRYAIAPVSPQQLTSALAWREGAIVFDGASLSDAVAEIERYTDARIVVGDPQTAALLVGGRFRTGNIHEFFDALQGALPITVRQGADGTIFIEPRH